MDLSHLKSLVPDSPAWERERTRLLNAQIDAAPERLRVKLRALQFELDLDRSTMSDEDFMKNLMVRITENMENILDLSQYVKNVLRSTE